jgi:tripartite-type tricarboxylate transporter receptor subunit TctC
MTLARRRFLHLAAGAAAMPVVSRVATAQTYPSRPITMIVGLAAGGVTDAIGRLFAERIRRSLGQPIIIENVTGADGSIGVGRAARARADGYTIDFGGRRPARPLRLPSTCSPTNTAPSTTRRSPA